MKEGFKTNAPYIIALFVIFYILPAVIRDTAMAMLLMLAVIPAAVFITAFIRGIKFGFSLMLALMAACLFVPTVFIWYNTSAIVYAAVYAAIAAAGCAFGNMFKGKR